MTQPTCLFFVLIIIIPTICCDSSWANKVVSPHTHASEPAAARWRGLPDTARPLVMRGLPEEQPVLSPNTEGAACESEEGQSLAEKGKKKKRETWQKGEDLFNQNE